MGAISAQEEQGLFASPALEKEQHWGRVGCSTSHPYTREEYSTHPTSLPPLSLCCLKRNQLCPTKN